MKNCNALENQTTRRILLIACATALAVAFTVSLPQPARAARSHRHPCPPTFRWTRGTRRSSWVTPSAPRTTSALPSATSATGVAYVLFTPEATLFNDDDTQLITHFFSPNPDPRDPTPIQRWWPMARFAPRGSTRGTRAPSGPRCTPTAPLSSTHGAIAWLLLDDGWSPRRTDRWRHADEDHLRPAAEHLWRGRTVDGL